MQLGAPARVRSRRRSAPVAVGDRLADRRRRGCGRLRRRRGRHSGSTRADRRPVPRALRRRARGHRRLPRPAQRPRARRGRRGSLRRRRRRPSRGGAEFGVGATVEVKVPAKAASGTVRAEGLRDRGRDAERPATEDRRSGPDPDRRPVQAHRRRGDPASDLLRRAAGAAGVLHLPGPRRHRRPGRDRQPRDQGGRRHLHPGRRQARNPQRRQVGRADDRRRTGAGWRLQVRARQRGGRRDLGHARTRTSATTSTASRSTHATPTATATAPAAATRARTCLRSAARRSTPPAAAACRRSTCSRRRATTSSSTARARSSTPCTPT